ncbi:hypothetical protein DRE_04539 [Drechslerella stenobrocha 248]|uniref:Uncharacterized protein n=1 Tax=Drechslerella stenobrocha 248 TaxID=1043628 RepID=W7HPU9_9PEZI|nr:hypothetical protein DRE_04539 [Drechslerella stenobrocha 248]
MNSIKALKARVSSTSLSNSDGLSESRNTSRTTLQQVKVRALPSGGRTHGPRRLVSAGSLPTVARSTLGSHVSLTRTFSLASSSGTASFSAQSKSSSSTGGSLSSTKTGSSSSFGSRVLTCRSPLQDIKTGGQNCKSSGPTPSLQPRQLTRQGRGLVAVDQKVTASSGEETSFKTTPAGASPPLARSAVALQGPRAVLPVSAPRLQGPRRTMPSIPLAVGVPPRVMKREQQFEHPNLSRWGPVKKLPSNDSDEENFYPGCGRVSPPKMCLEAPGLCNLEGRIIRRQDYPSSATREPAHPRLAPTGSLGGAFQSPRLQRFPSDDKPLWEEVVEEEDESDSDAGSDFGCVGLSVLQYEEMLAVGTGYPGRQVLVEEVDKWPETVKVYGYRKVWGYQCRGDDE